jgi:hypothetical protein
VRAVGVEYNPDMVTLSRRNAERAGVSDKATFVQADIFQADLSRATVLTLFLLTDLNLRLRPTILSLKPGTRVVSNTFGMGEWAPDQTFELNCTYCTAYLWIVPAKAEGRWQSPTGKFAFKQEFQKVTGTLKVGNSAVAIPIANGIVRADEISFTAGNSQYRGRVSETAIEGTVRSGGNSVAWRARRS